MLLNSKVEDLRAPLEWNTRRSALSGVASLTWKKGRKDLTKKQNVQESQTEGHGDKTGPVELCFEWEAPSVWVLGAGLYLKVGTMCRMKA